MDLNFVVMWVGFAMAAYSVVGNDVIQTLGTFLTSNEERVKWYILWLYAAAILVTALTLGWFDPFNMYDYSRGIAYGRLDNFEMPEVFPWYYLLPPIVLLVITRTGVPVSTTFMILTLFSLQNIPNDLGEMTLSLFDADTKLGGMVKKSLFGYLIAFLMAISIYSLISRAVEKRFIENPITPQAQKFWTVAQWLVTGMLWWQWLVQDLANIYIYLRGGDGQGNLSFFVSVVILVGLLGFIFATRGGKIQDIVRKKINTADIRSATIIDFTYASVLFIFLDDYFGLWGAKIPMSTTWVFVGLLAGRELGIRLNLEKRISKEIGRMLLFDVAKVLLGLVVSVIIVFVIKLLAAQGF